MRDSALSVANYFVQKSMDEHKDLKPLKLVKLVYIAHGFMLAMLDRSVFNKKFDKVEAWKYGPVIPSVYHSFKDFKNQPITRKTVIAKSDDSIDFTFEEPVLSDKNAAIVCDIVWKRYVNYSNGRLVDILHAAGTPWKRCYIPDMNVEIPDAVTQAYYKGLVRILLETARKNGWKGTDN